MFSPQQQFYPSTPDLSWDLRRRAQISRGQTVLDPTAGTGILLDHLGDRIKTYAIEIDQELRYILQGKGHTVIGSDFLDYSEPIHFDRILMNPPFNQGADMVLKAWEHLKPNGILVSLVNSATVNNPYTKKRQTLQNLIAAHGSTEDLGPAFQTAERPTDVHVSVITLHKPDRADTFAFSDAAPFGHSEPDLEGFKTNPLAHQDVIRDLVSRYKAAEQILINRHQTQQQLDLYLEGIADTVYDSQGHQSRASLVQPASVIAQLSTLKSRFWNTVFQRTELGQKTTSSFREKFSDYCQHQASLEFNEANITEMLSLFFLNREQIMSDCLLHVFDQVTKYHKKNTVHIEGWKTNKAAKLSPRIIHPNGVEWCSIMQYLTISWQRRPFLDDLDQCLCWLSGEDINEIQTTHQAIKLFLQTNGRTDYQQRFESTFFSIRVFKKGTMHLDFKDLYLLDDFNAAVAKGKQWIGPED